MNTCIEDICSLNTYDVGRPVGTSTQKPKKKPITIEDSPDQTTPCKLQLRGSNKRTHYSEVSSISCSVTVESDSFFFRNPFLTPE
jgi:hypothetical protein